MYIYSSRTHCFFILLAVKFNLFPQPASAVRNPYDRFIDKFEKILKLSHFSLTAPSRDEVYGQWYLAASSVVEWEAIADMYKDAKRSRDQELYSVINENFLPILPSVVEAEEKAKMKRMQELACTRQSSRLEEKRKEREMLQVLFIVNKH